MGGFPDGTCLQIDRGVTRLDGARGKMQVRRPHFWTWGIPEANVLYWKMCVWHCCFLGAHSIIRRPQSDSAPRVIAPPFPVITPLLIEPLCSVWKATDVYVSKTLAAMWQKCIERARLAQRIMTYCNYAIVQLFTWYTWKTQRSIELLQGA